MCELSSVPLEVGSLTVGQPLKCNRHFLSPDALSAPAQPSPASQSSTPAGVEHMLWASLPAAGVEQCSGH
eukprot:10641-Heterococcus_DN1.PRE.4